MKVIDLLNKIANGEEIPSKIHYGFDDYKLINYGGKTKFYQCLTEPYKVFNIKTDCLNDEIEILEEKKIPEKLIPTSLKGIDNLDEKIEIAHIDTISVIETVNQVIDYLKSKGKLIDEHKKNS